MLSTQHNTRLWREILAHKQVAINVTKKNLNINLRNNIFAAILGVWVFVNIPVGFPMNKSCLATSRPRSVSTKITDVLLRTDLNFRCLHEIAVEIASGRWIVNKNKLMFELPVSIYRFLLIFHNVIFVEEN